MPPRRSKQGLQATEEVPVLVEDNDVEMEDENPAEEDDEEGGIRIGDIYLPPPPPPACTFDNNGPRLIITHIENEFFKSYAGKQVLGPFHKSFTSIVGPNGSGKSNVIDSMLFVFGYRAQKIRSKKISVLIHNSEQHPNVQSCTVSVYFQRIIDGGGDDEFTVVPNTQFCVSRIAFKDNSSFYKVDGKRCQFKEVSKRLRKEGIDLDHNRFLILQGEVEQIAMMKPKAQSEHDTGMLEYLEDIVGSSRFKEPIELLYKRVEELNEQRGEKLNRVKLVEKEKDELEEPKNEAVSYLKLENDIVCRKNVLYQRYILDCTRNKEKAEQKKKDVDERMHDIKEKLAKIEEVRKVKEIEANEKKTKLEDILKTKEGLNEKFKMLESEDVKLQEELKHKNQKRKKLMIQLKTDKEKLIELEKAPEQNEKDVEECKTQREHLQVQFKKEQDIYHKAMASLNSETQQLQDEKEKLETELIDLRKEVDETKSALDIAQSELDIYLSTEKNEKKKYDQIKESLDKAATGLLRSQEEVATLAVKIPEYKEKEINNRNSYDLLNPQLIEKEKQLASARVSLEETRSSMSHSSRGQTLDTIMNEKESGRLPGIYGRLGDLGGIDEKFDVAISTACTSLENIVVNNIDTAQACIKVLKVKQKGTATFIALDKITKDWKRASEQKMSFPENVPRLFDLVRVKDINMKPAFYFALRDTLVARDLEQASRIGYGHVRHRVVTLGGELIEPQGTMTGGGKSMSKGRMGKSATIINVDPNKIHRVQADVDKLNSEIAEMRSQKVALENDIQSMSRDLKTMELNFKKYSREVESLEQQHKTLTNQLETQRVKVEACKPEQKKVTVMEKSINDKLKKYEKAASAAQEIEQQVNKIHAQIMEITGGKIKGMKKKMDATNKSLEKLTNEITRLQVASKTAKRNSKKTEEKIASMETEIKEVEAELLQYKDRKQSIEEEASGILENLKAVKLEETQLQDELEEIKISVDEVAQKENEVKSNKIEFDQEIEKYDGILKENKVKISHWEKQLKRLKLQEIPVDRDENEETELLELETNQLEELDPKNLQDQLTLLEEKFEQSRPNLAVLQEYKKKETVYFQRVAELEEITKSRDEQRKFHEDLRKQRLNEFMSGFTIISNKLKEMYQMITLGGDAELELVDSLDPFSEGIVFSVRPPKKSWKNITNLSGGEKTLSSLALVFALHYYKPTPLYVMDEIDAALDFKNVSIVGNYIKERTKNAQFIIISLRSQMFELADRLVGIFKTYNCTKSVTINPNNYSPPQKEPVSNIERGLGTASPKQVLLGTQS